MNGISPGPPQADDKKLRPNERQFSLRHYNGSLITSAVTVITIFVSIALFAADQKTQRDQQRRAKSLDFVENMQRAPVLNAAKNLLAPILSHPDAMQLEEPLHPWTAQDAILDAFTRNKSLYNDLIIVVQAYELAILCVNNNLCSREVMNQFIIPDVKKFHETFKVPITTMATSFNRPDFGRALNQYSIDPRNNGKDSKR